MQTQTYYRPQHFQPRERIADLVEEYATFQADNGLSLGAADEHLNDYQLTDTQRAYLDRFVCRWNQAERIL